MDKAKAAVALTRLPVVGNAAGAKQSKERRNIEEYVPALRLPGDEVARS